MSVNLKECLGELALVANAESPYVQKTILRELSRKPCFVAAMKEISINTVKGRLPLTERQRRKLLKIGKVVRDIARGKKTRKRIIQSGGFIKFVLPILGTLLGPVVERLINGRQ
jgi:hypothetical protein